MSEKSTTPLVSVIMPVYNVAPYLRQCLDSICNQTLTDIEIICVDDGSTDNSLAILHDYAARDSRVVVLQQQNQFAGMARQRGMEIAKGRYLAFLDSDDFFEPDMLKAMSDAADANNADMVVCGSDVYHEDSGVFRPAPHNLRMEYIQGIDARRFCPAEVIPLKLFHFVNPAPWAKLYRASFVKVHEFRWAPHQHTNDILFVCSALAMAKVLSVVDKVFVHYRVRSSSISHSKGKSLTGHYTAFRELKANLVRLNVSKGVLHSFNERLLTGVVWNLATLGSTRGRELRDLIIKEYEPEFQLLGEPISQYENKVQYRRYKALINPLMTVLLREGDLTPEQNATLLTKLLGIKDVDFDVVCLSYYQDSDTVKVYKSFAEKDIRCTHVEISPDLVVDDTLSYCRGKYVIRISHGHFLSSQMQPILAKVEQMEKLPAGIYHFEYLQFLFAAKTSIPVTAAPAAAVPSPAPKNDTAISQVLQDAERMLQLSLCAPILKRRYIQLKIKKMLSLGERRRRYKMKLRLVRQWLNEYHRLTATALKKLKDNATEK